MYHVRGFPLTWEGVADPTRVTLVELAAAPRECVPFDTSVILGESEKDRYGLYEIADLILLRILMVSPTGGDATSGYQVRACGAHRPNDVFQFSGNNLMFVSPVGESIPGTSQTLVVGVAASQRVVVIGARANNDPMQMQNFYNFVKVRLNDQATDYTGGFILAEAHLYRRNSSLK